LFTGILKFKGVCMNRIGQEFEDYIGFLLVWIREDSIGPAIAAVITFFGLTIISIALYQTFREQNLIKKARLVIGNRSEEAFAREFNKISQDLGEIPRIRDAWSEFSETLILPKFDEQKNMLRPCENTQRPHAYFNVRELSMGPDFLKVFPSVFVGIGLSLTFLGLISALGEAVNAINTAGENTQNIQTAIGNLLKISSAKFYASLFALFMSVLMTISLRLMSWTLSGSMSKLNRSLEAGVRFLTPEQLALTANDLLRNQLAQLNTFNTDLAMKIGGEVSSSLAPLITKLDSMSGNLTQQNIDAIQNITSEVTQSIQGATVGAMDRVAATLDSISDKLGGLSDSLSGALSNFDSDFSNMLEGLKSSLVESTSGVADGIDASMIKMSEGVSNTAGEMSEIFNRLSRTIEGIANTGAEISAKGGEELRKQVEAASRQASEQISNAGKELASGFQSTTQGLIDALSGTTSKLKQLEENLIALPEQLNNVNIQLSESASQIGDSANRFSSASSGIRNLIEPLTQYASDTRESISQITSTMQEATTKIGEASTQINQAVATMETSVNSQLNKLDGADAKLAELLMGIEDSTVRVLTQVNTFVTEVDQGMARSVGVLNDSIAGLDEALNNMRDLVRETR